MKPESSSHVYFIVSVMHPMKPPANERLVQQHMSKISKQVQRHYPQETDRERGHAHELEQAESVSARELRNAGHDKRQGQIRHDQ